MEKNIVELANNKKQLSIFVDSYDGNKDLWKNLFDVFDYFWPNCPYDRYLVTNSESFSRKKINVIKTGEEVNWFSTTLNALKQIDTKYIWFFLDDYYLSKMISNDDIEEIINYMDNNDIFFYRLSLRSDLDKKYIRHQITGESVYAINLQPVIWNRENFISKLEMLQTLGCKSPWDFERYFINYFENKKSKEIISGIIYDTRDIMGFKNAVIQGKWVRHVIKFYKDEFGIILDIGSRECMSYFAEFFDYVKTKGNNFISYKTKKKMKKILKCFGFKFMTD